MNKPTKRSLPVSALVTIVAAFAIPARAEGPIARVPVVQENSTDPDLKAIFDNARNRGGQVINLVLIRGNAPKLARAASAMAYAIRFDTKPPRPLVALAILRQPQLCAGGEDQERGRRKADFDRQMLGLGLYRGVNQLPQNNTRTLGVSPRGHPNAL